MRDEQAQLLTLNDVPGFVLCHIRRQDREDLPILHQDEVDQAPDAILGEALLQLIPEGVAGHERLVVMIEPEIKIFVRQHLDAATYKRSRSGGFIGGISAGKRAGKPPVRFQRDEPVIALQMPVHAVEDILDRLPSSVLRYDLIETHVGPEALLIDGIFDQACALSSVALPLLKRHVIMRPESVAERDADPLLQSCQEGCCLALLGHLEAHFPDAGLVQVSPDEVRDPLSDIGVRIVTSLPTAVELEGSCENVIPLDVECQGISAGLDNAPVSQLGDEVRRLEGDGGGDVGRHGDARCRGDHISRRSRQRAWLVRDW
jgi:hypothetical protein